MTVTNTTARNQYTATAGQTVFAYTFEVYNKNDLVVLQNDTTLAEGTNYTVSGVGSDSGGNITLTVGATAGDIITVYRDMALERLTDYQNAGDFLAAEVNEDFDRLWLATQQNATTDERSIRKPVVDIDSINMELPAASSRANKLLSFDGSGNVQTLSSTTNAATDATNVTYTATGTGAVGRTVQSRLTESISVKDFGAKGDGTTDDTAAIQAAINYAATAKLGVVYLPAGHYSITRIYLNHDPSNNTGYPSDSYYQGRIALQGDGRATKQNQSNSARTGTLIESTLTTGNVIVCDGTSSGTTAQQVQIKDLSVYASTSGSVFRFISVVQNSGFENVYIRQGGSGEGINWQDCWVSFIRNVRIDGAGKATSNDGIYLRNITSAGGFVDMVSVIVNAFHTSIRIGHENYGSGARLHSVNMQNCQGGEAQYGLEIAHGADQVNLLGCHFEDNDTGLFIVNGASNVSIDGSSFATNTVSSQCGNDTANGDRYQGVSFFNNKFFSNSGTTEHIKLFSSSDTGDVLIEQCSFTGDSGATDTAIWLEDADHHHVRLLAPEFISNLSTEIANASRIQEYHDEKSVYWRTVNTGGSLSNVPFRFRSDTSAGGLASVEFSQNDNDKAFIRFDTDITPSTNSNHISTTNAAGSVTGPSDGSWTFSRMVLIETNDATGVGEYWMPLFTKN